MSLWTKVLIAVISTAFLSSNAWLLVENRRLSEDLVQANAAIFRLRANAHSRVADLSLKHDWSSPCEPSGEPLEAADIASALQSVDTLSLAGLRDQYLDATGSRALTLFIFFSPTDCPMCLEEIALWNRLHQETDGEDLQMLAVIDHRDKREVEQFLEGAGIKFPYILDDRNLLEPFFGVEQTPYKIVIDHRGEIVLVQPRARKSEGQRENYSEIKRLVQRTRGHHERTTNQPTKEVP